MMSSQLPLVLVGSCLIDKNGDYVCDFIKDGYRSFILNAVNSHAQQQERIEELERTLRVLIAIVDGDEELSAGFRSTILWVKDVYEGASNENKR